MTRSNDQEGLIASDDLSLENVPPPSSDRETLEAFCLTIDGYQDGRYSPEDLFREVQRIERAGLENATLDDLRIAAFFCQRDLRWSSWGDDVADAPLVQKIRGLVGEIRRRLGQQQGGASG